MVSGKRVICLSSHPYPGPLYSQRLRAAEAEVIELELPSEGAPGELDKLLTRAVPESRPIDGLLVVTGAPFERPIRQIHARWIGSVWCSVARRSSPRRYARSETISPSAKVPSRSPRAPSHSTA